MLYLCSFFGRTCIVFEINWNQFLPEMNQRFTSLKSINGLDTVVTSHCREMAQTNLDFTCARLQGMPVLVALLLFRLAHRLLSKFPILYRFFVDSLSILCRFFTDSLPIHDRFFSFFTDSLLIHYRFFADS